MELSRQDRIDPSLSIMVGPGDPDLGRAPDHIRSVPHFFELMASDAPWLRFEGHVYTVADIWTQAAEWASSIRLHGIGPGDCVALLMCNRPEFIISWLAVNMTGATAAFVPVAAAESGLERYFASIRPQLAIFEAELGAELLADGAGLRQLAPDVFMRALNGRSASDPIADEAPSPSDVSCLVFTSGSSGPPKAVAFSHRYVLELGYHIAHGKGMQPAEKLYFCNPLFHGDGLIATITTVSLKGEMHLARRFSVRQFWSDVASYGSTMFYYVGASLSFLARNPFPETPPRHSLRFATGGGATEAVATLFEERFGIPVLDAYSQTECLCCCSNTLGARRKGTVGRPYPGMEVRIVDDLAAPGRPWQLRVVGALELLPTEIGSRLAAATSRTVGRTGLQVNVAVGYGGRQEIADAVRKLLLQHAESGTSIEELADVLDVDHIAAHLYTSGQPDPDLIIRTSGEQRLSGFLLWQSAHSEFWFCEAYWPEFRRVDFLRALRDYAARHRRFGS